MRTTKIVSTNKFIGALIFVFIICTPAFALTPEIYSMEPDYGANDSPTDITVHGDNFEPIPVRLQMDVDKSGMRFKRGFLPFVYPFSSVHAILKEQ